MAKGYCGAGVYVFRTRRPGVIGYLPGWLGWVSGALALVCLSALGYPPWPAALALLFTSRHFAYVGETTAVNLRKDAHLRGSVKYNTPAKPWADLAPTHYFLPLPGAPKFVLRSIETLLIALFWPVYNHQKNLWNPRRIPLSSARRQRGQRDFSRWSFNLRPAHLAIWVFLIGFMIMNREAWMP